MAGKSGGNGNGNGNGNGDAWGLNGGNGIGKAWGLNGGNGHGNSGHGNSGHGHHGNGPVRCFTPGTLIATAEGDRPVEDLAVGDLVRTRDHGLRPIRWVGRQSLSREALLADPTLRPVGIAKGALGGGLPLRDMAVSRQHRMLVAGPRAELLFGEEEVLVRAVHLVHLPGVAHREDRGVIYIHILFDRHELVMADGAWSESYQPGDRTLDGMDAPAREELFRIFPELAEREYTRFDAARTTLKGFETRVLLPA